MVMSFWEGWRLDAPFRNGWSGNRLADALNLVTHPGHSAAPLDADLLRRRQNELRYAARGRNFSARSVRSRWAILPLLATLSRCRRTSPRICTARQRFSRASPWAGSVADQALM